MPSAKQILSQLKDKLNETIANDKDPAPPESYEKLIEQLHRLTQKTDNERGYENHTN